MHAIVHCNFKVTSPVGGLEESNQVFYCFVSWSNCSSWVFLVLVGQSTIRNGTLNDEPRVQYLQSFIGSLLDAIRYAFSEIKLMSLHEADVCYFTSCMHIPHLLNWGFTNDAFV